MQLSRAVRCVLVLAAAVVLGVTTPAQQKLHAQAVKPNIVVIMTDDLDVPSFRALVAAGMMPNVKRYLLDVGVDFTNSFAVSGLASPARASFLTGQYPHNHLEIGSNPLVGGPPRFNQNSTVATWLRAAGYRTGHVGRYITGYGLWTAPLSIPPGWDHWETLLDPTTWSTDKYTMNIRGSFVDFGALAQAAGVELYQTDMLALLAGTFVRQAPQYNKPFFLVVAPPVYNREMYPGPSRYNLCPDASDPIFGGSYWGVSQRPAARHNNTIFGDVLNFSVGLTPSFNEADISDKPDWAQANPLMTADDVNCLQMRHWRRMEAMRAVDDLVGHVFGQLEATGALANTAVVFTADNGLLDGQHRFPEKMPAYEESIRIPLIVRLPGMTTGRVNAAMTITMDLTATIAQLAQATPTNVLDGRSLVPILSNPAAGWRRMVLLEHVLASPQGPGFTGPPDYFALRTGGVTPQRLYVRYPTVTTGLTGELYELNSDPYQLENLYGNPAYQPTRDALETWLNAMKTCRGLSCYVLENLFALN